MYILVNTKYTTKKFNGGKNKESTTKVYPSHERNNVLEK